MTESVVRLFVGTLTLVGAAAGAVASPQTSAAAATVSAAVRGPIFMGVAAGLLLVLALVVTRRHIAAPTHAEKHRA